MELGILVDENSLKAISRFVLRCVQEKYLPRLDVENIVTLGLRQRFWAYYRNVLSLTRSRKVLTATYHEHIRPVKAARITHKLVQLINMAVEIFIETADEKEGIEKFKLKRKFWKCVKLSKNF
ncbi:2534_t:CDS:2 [Ambispora gerdemannii]|uniref:2534_t:CDS:1 n=1 Tax=Ambispora gerdemannii TaxID=144530 RepID=A0A9N9BF18_9GLOM|nr:2534_t:CDS:2 [Ambispora gerdemannii]